MSKGDTFEIEQTSGTTLVGTLHDPQATTGQVLTVQTDKSIAAEPAPSLPPSGPAGGDLTGNYPNPTIAPAAQFHDSRLNLICSASSGSPLTFVQDVLQPIPFRVPSGGQAGGDLTLDPDGFTINVAHDATCLWRLRWGLSTLAHATKLFTFFIGKNAVDNPTGAGSPFIIGGDVIRSCVLIAAEDPVTSWLIRLGAGRTYVLWAMAQEGLGDETGWDFTLDVVRVG